MALIYQKKKKTAILVVAVLTTLILVGFVVTYMFIKSDKKENKVKQQDTSFNVEVEATEKLILSEAEESMKEYYIDYISVGEGQSIDEYLDIHIRFPNGEDYIVASGKKISSLTEEGFNMYLEERDVHMLSSARTDMEVYGGTTIYLASYRIKNSDAVEDYPWNQFVMSSYGIGDENASEIYEKRVQLEENLIAFMNQTLKK